MAKPKTRNIKKKKKEKKTLADLTEKERKLFESADQAAFACYLEGRYEEALRLYKDLSIVFPEILETWINMGACCCRLSCYREAIEYGEKALQMGAKGFSIYDLLVEAHSALNEMDACRKYGQIALEIRGKQFGGPPLFPHDFPTALPPPPSPETRNKNIIAFSLFGAKSKYCETAVLNALAQPEFYPNWTCRFYIDETVPVHVIRRFVLARAEVVVMKEGDVGRTWPGPMWRFLALNDDLHRVIFRDADSVLTEKEVLATEEWVKSGKLFHVMRDHDFHVELILAGLWGCVGGALPPLSLLTDAFFNRPVVVDPHFADQCFLREFIWPYARQNLLLHDSAYTLFNAKPYPLDIRTDEFNANFHLGMAEGGGSFTAKADLPEGTPVYWAFFLVEGDKRTHICTYPGIVRNGIVSDNIPSRYAVMIQNGAAEIRLLSGPDATE